MLRIYTESQVKDNVWRIAGNIKNVLNYLPKNTKTGKITWQSVFKIHHKVAQQLTWDNIGIIGDAAHLHSPVGARGMNLGIEDAYILSNLIHNGELNQFDKLRKPYVKKTVDTINTITMRLTGDSKISRNIRKNIGVLKFVFPLVTPTVRRFVLGLN